MRNFVIALFSAVALAACQAPTSSAPEEAGPPMEAPAEPAPAEPAEPAPTDPVTEAPAVDDAPAPEEAQAAPEPSPAPVDNAPSSGAAREQAQAAPEPPRTRGLAAPRATPVIVEIDRTQDRRAANGGSAVVLFTSGGASLAARNLATCTSIWSMMNTATTQEVRVGVRKAADGTVEALRPLYWLKNVGGNAPTGAAAAANCTQRMTQYDYARARTIRDKYGLTGAGPYFIVARTDEKAAAVIDLTGKPTAEIDDMVRYFRDGFAFQNDIWDPARNDPARKRALLTGFFGDRFRESMLASLGFVSNPAARAGCRLGDLRDAPCT